MFAKILEYAGEYRRRIWLAASVLLVGVLAYVIQYACLFQIIRPLLMQGHVTVEAALPWVVAIFACGLAHGLLYVRGLDISHDAAYGILRNLRITMQARLERQPLGTIQDRGSGGSKKLFVDDVDNLELLLAHALPEGVANLAVPILVFTALFVVDWKLGLLSLCSLPLGILSAGIMYRSGMSGMDAYYAASQRLSDIIVEYVRGMEVVKVFNRDVESFHRFEEQVVAYRDITIEWWRESWPWMALYTSVLPCVALATLPVGAWLVTSGLVSLPDLALALCLDFAAGVPLMRSMGFMAVLPQINRQITAIEQAMDAEPLRQADAPFSGEGLAVRFDDVRFSYKDQEVLHGVTLDVEQGSMVALVGESGSGKSTLARLLVHYYDVDSGTISLGGQDLRAMSLEALSEQVSYVSQEQFLFKASLRENIRMGRLGATDAEVEAAAERAQCMEFVREIPGGLDADAGEAGSRLSGGQRQRISIARALVKDAPIVVLDEATAFMDPENERRMGEAIASVIEGKTVIVIAHRLQTVVGADRIFVMDAGNLLDAGTHDELLARCEKYRTLWEAHLESARWRASAKA